jgi:hypothetical protein
VCRRCRALESGAFCSKCGNSLRDGAPPSHPPSTASSLAQGRAPSAADSKAKPPGSGSSSGGSDMPPSYDAVVRNLLASLFVLSQRPHFSRTSQRASQTLSIHLAFCHNPGVALAQHGFAGLAVSDARGGGGGSALPSAPPPPGSAGGGWLPIPSCSASPTAVAPARTWSASTAGGDRSRAEEHAECAICFDPLHKEPTCVLLPSILFWFSAWTCQRKRRGYSCLFVFFHVWVDAV